MSPTKLSLAGNNFFFVYFFGRLECVGHSFAYVAHLWFLRDVWIRTKSAPIPHLATPPLASHPSLTYSHPSLRGIIKRLAIFLSPAGMSPTKLFLAGNNLIIIPTRESLVSGIPAGDGKNANLFLQCMHRGAWPKVTGPQVKYMYTEWLKISPQA